MYRLHIDIPLGTDEIVAIQQATSLMHWHFSDEDAQEKLKMIMGGVEQVNYRLGHDEDRQKSNYLNKTENGHVTNKKSRINLNSSDDSSQNEFDWVGDMEI